MSDASTAAEPRFSLVAGGPFNAGLGRLGLLDADQLPSAGGAFALAAIAWLLPGACALLQAQVMDGYRASGYFADVSTLARYFVAVGIMLYTDHRADQRTLAIVREFLASGLIRATDRARYAAHVRQADRWSTAWPVEAALLALAWVAAGQTIGLTVHLETSGWETVASGGGRALSWAGLAARHVAIPLFLFLALRWLWRLAVWSVLLVRIARMPLRLRALHPDRCGGLGFLTLFPGAFRGFVFALSCVLAALVLKEMHNGVVEVTTDILRDVIAGWAVLVALLFLAPLLAFYEPLFDLREEAIRDTGTRSNRWLDQLEARWRSGDTDEHPGVAGADAPGFGEIQDVVATVHAIGWIPLDRIAVINLYFAAMLPLVLVALSRIPVKDLLARIGGIVV